MPEYAPFGEVWVTREDASEEWVEVAEADVPADVVTYHREVLPTRRALLAAGLHPDGDQAPERIVVRKVSEGAKTFAEAPIEPMEAPESPTR